MTVRGETRPRYRDRQHADNLTQAGAEGLANVIRAFWFKQGKFPNVSLVKQSAPGAEGGHGMFCVRSDMLNGTPRELR